MLFYTQLGLAKETLVVRQPPIEVTATNTEIIIDNRDEVLSEDSGLSSFNNLSRTSADDIEKALAAGDWKKLQQLLPLYRQQNTHDPVLANFAEAIFWRNQGYPARALPLYVIILHEHPDYQFVRLGYAQALFEDRQYQNAKQQFAQIDITTLHPKTAKMLKAYQRAIEKKYSLTFSGNLSYEKNDNVNGASKKRELIINGLVFQKNEDSLPKRANGIAYQLGTSKLFPIDGPHHLKLGIKGNGIHYFEMSKFNEEHIRLYTAYINQSKRHTWKIEPYYEQGWYGGNRYNKMKGFSLQYQYEPTFNWQIILNGNYAYIKYKDYEDVNNHQNQLGATLVYQKPTYYLYAGIFRQNNNTQSIDWKNHRNHLLLGGQYLFNDKLGLQIATRISNRKFQTINDYAGIKRKDKEKYLRLGLFNPQWEWHGFLPILNWQYEKTDSNIPELYQKENKVLYLSVEKKW